MDLVTVSFLVLATLGAIAALLHMLGWVPPRYKRVLSHLQAEFASKVGVEVENALERVSVRQRASLEEFAGPDPLSTLPAAIGAEVKRALTEVAAEQEAKFAEAAKAVESVDASDMTSALQSIKRGVGVEKMYKRQVDSAMAEAILGPAKPILAQFAPGLLDTLEHNPSLLPMIIEHPLFQKYIAPRIQQLLGQGGEEVIASQRNPFLNP